VRCQCRGGWLILRALRSDSREPAVMHGNKASTAVGCTSDEEVLKGLLDVVPSHHFAFGRFMALTDLFGCKCCVISCFSPLLLNLRDFHSGTTSKATPGAPPPIPRNPHFRPIQLQHTSQDPPFQRTALMEFTDPRRMAARPRCAKDGV
jgi:RNA exonuclease 1